MNLYGYKQHWTILQPEKPLYALLSDRGNVTINYVENSLDWIFAEEPQLLVAVAFVMAHFIMLNRRDHRVRIHVGKNGFIIYSSQRTQASGDQRKRVRTILAIYFDKPSKVIDAERAESIDLKNNITISIATCSWRSTRGFTLVACLADELAFWSSEDSANPDFEVLNAIRPAMATIPNAMLLCASSPYARKGALWAAYKDHFGKDHDPILVFQGGTREFNPTVSQSFIDAEIERDPANASAEFFGNFRSDVEAFINRDAVEACVSVGVSRTRSGSSPRCASNAEKMSRNIGPSSACRSDGREKTSQVDFGPFLKSACVARSTITRGKSAIVLSKS